MVVKIRS